MEGRQEGVEPLDRAMICRLLAVKWRQSHGVIARCNSAVLRRLVTQDKDLEVLGGVTAAELGEESDGAAQGQVGRSWQHRGKPRSMRTPSSWALSEYLHPTGMAVLTLRCRWP